MSEPVQWYTILLLAGLLLLGAEVIVPGGILGAIGALALLAAIIMGFVAFGADLGSLSAILIIATAGISLFLWMKFLPSTRMGRILTLEDSTANFKATDSMDALLGASGRAVTRLRPGGIAELDGKRYDVLSEGRWVEEGSAVTVVRTEGNVITVRETESAPHA